MSWKLLPTDYTDRTWNDLQRFNEIDNGDGTVSFLDVTVYTNKEKSFFGAKDANRMNEALNTLMSMVEQGTDLYEVFQQYFETQKDLFEQESTDKQNEYDSRLSDLDEQATTTLTLFTNYINQLKDTADQDVQEIKDDYAEDIARYEATQQAVFDAWFQAMRDQLSKDAAGNLQNEIDTILANLITIEVSCQEVLEGHTITCTDGTNTKTAVVDTSHKVSFGFGKYGTFTVTDDFTGMPTTFNAYHYGYYPINVQMGVISVTCPKAMVGFKVSCVKDDVKYEKTVGDDCIVTFGAPTFGTWTLKNTLTDEELTVYVSDYSTYKVEFQIATITVTCDTAYEGENVNVTNGTLAYTQTVPESGIVEFSIPKFGEWVVSNTRVTDRVTVNVNAYTSYNVSFGVVAVKITCGDASFAGETVYFKKETETISAVIPDDLEITVELSGLGEWKCTNTRTTAEYTVSATTYQVYNIVLSLATLEVNYTEDFIGADFTISEIGGTRTETKTADGSLKLYFAIDLGRWQVSNTLTATKKTVEATEYTTYSTTFKAEELACVGSYVGVFTNK